MEGRNSIKTLAMYLPQFYRTPENDQWWGEGFTEWTAVKAAKPLFDAHNQPRVPQNHNYYNLLEKETMRWQSDLMHQYGIDGMCFYHYYFKDGRKVLNKPAENLLNWKDIDMPFCFDWANDPWVRTWSNLEGNTWSELNETKKDYASDILLEQKYGREKAWENHYNYLADFFADERYIRIDGRPVFLIHRASTIPCLYSMIKYWKMLSDQKHIPHMFIITVGDEITIKGTDAVMALEPNTRAQKQNGIPSFEYDDVLKRVHEAKRYDGQKKYLSIVTDYDTTPRRGVNGAIERGFSVQKFKEGMIKLYQKSFSWKNEFVFINAWNEWAEGMYLEPDETYGVGCLEAVREAQKIVEKEIESIQEEKTYTLDRSSKSLVRSQRYVNCLETWLRLKEKNISISTVLAGEGIKRVAVYGYGMLGKHLLNELKGSETKVDYIIDRNNEYSNLEHKVYSTEDDLPPTDAVIVTALGDYEIIYDMLTEKMPGTLIFSIYELVSESV